MCPMEISFGRNNSSCSLLLQAHIILYLHIFYRVLVMSNGQSPNLLTKMNSVIRRIDLTCKFLATVFTSFIISFISLRATTIIFSVWNIISVFIEYWLLTCVQWCVTSLSESDQRRNSRAGGGKIS
jgi:Ferroportin1 (FPN1)